MGFAVRLRAGRPAICEAVLQVAVIEAALLQLLQKWAKRG